MARKKLEPGKFYHIYNHANEPENLFRASENYRFFLEKWARYIEPIARTYAYCLMPNHFHFLIKIRDEADIEFGLQISKGTSGKNQTFQNLVSKQFSNLFSSYTQAYNKLYSRKGSLFIPNFKAKEINSDSYLTRIIFYIHHNPLHHGFCSNLEDWPHSSYHALVSEKITRLQRQDVRDWFGSKEELQNFHNQAIKGLHQLEWDLTKG